MLHQAGIQGVAPGKVGLVATQVLRGVAVLGHDLAIGIVVVDTHVEGLGVLIEAPPGVGV